MSGSAESQQKRAALAPAMEGLAEQHPAVVLEDLDCNILVTVLKWLTPQEVAAASLTSKLLHNASEASVLWQHLYGTSVSQAVRDRLMPPPEQIFDWRAAVIRGLMLEQLQYGMWERLNGTTACLRELRPCAREGHAAAAWGKDSMILFGGWGSGIRNDLFILDRVYDDEEAAAAAAAATTTEGTSSASNAAAGPSSSLGCPGSGPSGSGGTPGSQSARSGGTTGSPCPWLGVAERSCKWRWRVPRVAGRRPAIRYGHSVTRCGAAGELLVVYGGMQSGGYTAEINSLAVLRPYKPEGEEAGGKDVPHHHIPRNPPLPLLPRPQGDPALEPEYEYEWFHPELKGPDPGRRGYHSAAVSQDGLKLFLFGGIARQGSITQLTVIDLATWTVEPPDTTGPQPSPRFGCSLVVYDNRLWVLGGGNGSDLARSGQDLYDIYTLDLARHEWSRVETVNRPHSERIMGRCHASCLVGSKLVMFGGSLELSNDVTWLDLETATWGRPAGLLGQPPGRRMSAVMCASGSDLLVFGGWIYSTGEMGDLHRVRLLLSPGELAAARQVAAGADVRAAAVAAATATAAAGPSGSGGGCRRAPAPDPEDLTELLSTKVARYYKLMRAAGAAAPDDESRPVPPALVREMQETMMAIGLLSRSLAQGGGGEDEEEEEGEGEEWAEGQESSANDGAEEEEEEGQEDEVGEEVEVQWFGVHDESDEGAEEGERGGVAAGDNSSYDSEETGEEETSSEDEGPEI